jgi:hypothetical protein
MMVTLRTSDSEARCLRLAAVLAVSLVVLSAAAQAQASTSDVQSRTGVSLNLNLPKKWLADVELQDRRVDNLSTHRASCFTLGAGYNLTKRVQAFASYRLAVASDWKSHRYALGMEYETKAGRWRLGFRPMIQHRTKAADDDETGGTGATFVRTRLQVEHVLTRRLDVYGSVEPFFAFGADYPIDNWRDTVGLKYELAKDVRVDLYYIYRPDYGKRYNRLFHVIGLTLRFKAKIRGK